MFKAQSLTFSFKSYLKRPEKTTSNEMRRKNATLEATSAESQEKMFWRAKRDFQTQSKWASDDDMKDICWEATKAIGHFRITFGLFFKASPGAHLFIGKLVFICMWMKTNFHMKGWAPGLALKKRPKVIRKWPIIRAFKMGGMSNSYQHRIVSFSFTIAGSFSINDGNGNDNAIN